MSRCDCSLFCDSGGPVRVQEIWFFTIVMWICPGKRKSRSLSLLFVEAYICLKTRAFSRVHCGLGTVLTSAYTLIVAPHGDTLPSQVWFFAHILKFQQICCAALVSLCAEWQPKQRLKCLLQHGLPLFSGRLSIKLCPCLMVLSMDASAI